MSLARASSHKQRSQLVLADRQGQGVIEIMIAIGIMGILMAAFASMTTNQQRQIQQLSQKLAALDLERSLTSTLADDSVCTYLVTNPALSAFDPLLAASQTFSFNAVPLRGVAGSPNVVSVSATTPASPMSQSLYINSISIADLTCVPAPCTGTTNEFRANLKVGFDATKLVMGLSPLTFPITLNSTGAANSQTITSCGTTSNPAFFSNTACVARALNTVYTNTTGKPMYVSAVVVGQASWVYTQLRVNGQMVSMAQVSYPVSNQWITVYGVVPPGAQYEVVRAGGRYAYGGCWNESF